jgi:hypothetical protein
VEQHEDLFGHFLRRVSGAGGLAFASDAARMCQEMVRGASANPDHFRTPHAPGNRGESVERANPLERESPRSRAASLQILK